MDVVELLLDYGASVNAPFPNSRLVKEVGQIGNGVPLVVRM